jgi:hypothetical protein
MYNNLIEYLKNTTNWVLLGFKLCLNLHVAKN